MQYSGAGLLRSYDPERIPVAERVMQHSKAHTKVHTSISQMLQGVNPHVMDQPTEAGIALRQKVHEYYQKNDGEHKHNGIEMGYIYESEILQTPRSGSKPVWQEYNYVPSTWPGNRAPHVFLSDGSAIFDHFGREWTLVSFIVYRLSITSMTAPCDCSLMPQMLSAFQSSISASQANVTRERFGSETWCLYGRMSTSPGAQTPSKTRPERRESWKLLWV